MLAFVSMALYEDLWNVLHPVGTSGSVRGIAVRQYFAKCYTSPQGSVPWKCGKNVTFVSCQHGNFSHGNKLVVSQNTFSYVIKIVPPFPFQNLIRGVAVSRVHKQWEPGGLFFILTKFHTHTKQQENCILYTLIFIFLDSKLEDKRFCTE